MDSIDSDGFTLKDGDNTNQNNESYVAWNWKESATAGFDIVSYTGDGNSPRNIAHNLGVAPEVVIVKRRNDTEDWFTNVGAVLGSGKDGHYLKLNTTATEGTAAGPFNSANPTSSHFVTQGDSATNANNDTYIAYCFSSVEGYSKFGIYTGNGSDNGPFIYTGFRPAWLIYKRVDDTGKPWYINDSVRSPYNVIHNTTVASTNAVEQTSSNNTIDFYSNGWKVRKGATSTLNASGGQFLYMAFAESPFKYSDAR